ncbi:MAG: hypothetical protein WD595_06665 [Waddliaceae bacterium]
MVNSDSFKNAFRERDISVNGKIEEKFPGYSEISGRRSEKNGKIYTVIQSDQKKLPILYRTFEFLLLTILTVGTLCIALFSSKIKDSWEEVFSGRSIKHITFSKSDLLQRVGKSVQRNIDSRDRNAVNSILPPPENDEEVKVSGVLEKETEETDPNFKEALSSFAKSLSQLPEMKGQESEQDLRLTVTNLFTQTYKQQPEEKLEHSVESWLFDHLNDIKDDNDRENLSTISRRFTEFFGDHSIEKFEQILNVKDKEQLLRMLKDSELDSFQHATLLLKLADQEPNKVAEFIGHRRQYKFSEEAIYLVLKTIYRNLGKEVFLDIAKITAEKYPWHFGSQIKAFANAGLEKKDVNALAKIAFEKNSLVFENDIKDFIDAGLDKEIVKEFVETFIKRNEAYRIYNAVTERELDKETVNALAQIMAEKNPKGFGGWIKHFVKAGLEKKYVNALAKKILPDIDFWHFADIIGSIVDVSDNVDELAEIVVEKIPYKFIQNINDLVRAKLVTKKNIYELAKIVAEKVPGVFANNIKDFIDAGLEKNYVNELVKTMAEKDPDVLEDYIDDFIDTSDNVNELAEIVAKKAPVVFAYYIKAFVEAGLDKDNVNKLSIKAYFASPDIILLNEFPDLFPNEINEGEIDSLCSLIKQELQEEDKLIGKILENLKNQTAQQRNTVLIWTLYALGKANALDHNKAKMPKDSIYKYLTLISKRKDRQTRIDLTRLLIDDVAENEVKTKVLEKLLNSVKNKANFGDTLKHSCVYLATLPLSERELNDILSLITSKRKTITDGIVQPLLFKALKEIRDSEKTEIQRKAVEILKEIISNRKKIEVRNHLTGLIALIKVAPEKIDEVKDLSDINSKFLQKFKNLIPMQDLNDFLIKYEKFFGADLGALPLYASLHQKTPKVPEALATFTTWAVEDQFAERYNKDNSTHLRTLFKDENLKANWTAAVDLSKVSAAQENDAGPKPALKIEDNLYIKIITDNHLKGEYASLKKWLKSESRDDVLKSLESELSESEAKEDPEIHSLLLQHKIIKLCQSSEERERVKLVGELIKLCNEIQEEEFVNDLREIQHAFKPQMSVYKKVIDTDKPFYLLTAGQVGGSCQRLDGSPGLNKCLTGYLIDGKNRMIALVDEQGNLKGRSFIRLLLDKDNQPVLFLERAYPGNMSDKDKEMIIQGAVAKAKRLNVPLHSLQMGQGVKYAGIIQSKGSNAPYEYADASDGVGVTEGVWSVQNSHILWKPGAELESKEE